MQILRMLFKRPQKNSAAGRLTLKRSFFVCLHHSLSTFALYGQNKPEQGLGGLNDLLSMGLLMVLNRKT